MRNEIAHEDIEALREAWRIEPPVAAVVAALAGYEAPPNAEKQRAFEAWADKQLGAR